MTMTATTMPAAPTASARPAPRMEIGATLPLHLAGASVPPALRMVGALAVLLLAVAVTGLVLMAAAVVLPFGLVAAALTRRPAASGARRSGWRPAPA